MVQTTLCRLCLKVCSDYVSLYNKTGQPNNICKRMLKYFDSMFLNVEQVAESSVLCLECCGHISVFYNFQQVVFQAQMRLREREREIEFEFKKKISEERILNNKDNSHVTVKQDDSISLPDLELMEEFMFEDNFQNRDDQVNPHTAIKSIPLCERADVEEDNDQSNDQPLSISDSLESEKGIRKQNADVPIPLCKDTEQFGDRNIMNNSHTEQSEDHPLSNFDKSDSENGSDSDDKQPLMAIKRKLTRSQISVPKHLEAARAQRNASLVCEVCKKSLSNFKSLSDHFLLEHPNMFKNEPVILCASTEKIGNNKQTDDPFESEKGRDSGYIQPTTRIKRKLTERSISDEAVIDQWKPRLKCVVCKKPVTDILSLRLHFRREHPKERYRVECCGRKFYERSKLAMHARFHLNPDKLTEISISDEAVINQWKPRLKCVVCKKPVTDIRSLRLHFRREHPKERYRVECCGRKFYERSKLAMHARFHLNPDKLTEISISDEAVIDQWKPRLKCVVCKKPVPDIRSLRLHFRRVHPKERYRVECCGRKFYERSKLAMHARFHLNPEKRTQRPIREDYNAVISQWKPSLECVVCKKSVPDFRSLRLHFRSEHPKERYRVECCNRKFYVRSKLAEHARFHLYPDNRTQKPISEDLDAVIAQWKPSLECVVCKKSVTNFLSLRLHFRLEHPKERCRVECCVRKFYQRSKLAEHARFHFNSDQIKCLQCDSCFSTKVAMNVHLYTCKIANSKLRRKSSIECTLCKTSCADFFLLRKHYHLEHPTEVCYASCCGRKFYENNVLEHHMRLHRDPNAFQCKKCGRRLTRPYTLKMHMLSCENN